MRLQESCERENKSFGKMQKRHCAMYESLYVMVKVLQKVII